MAKKPKKASAEPGEGGAGEAPKSKKKLIMMAAAGLLVVGGGAGYFLMKGGHGDEGKDGGAEAEQASAHGGGHGGGQGGGHGGGAEAKKQVAFFELREMIINLSPDAGQDKGKFAKLRVALELKDPKLEEEVKSLAPRIEDTLQVYLREVRASDLSGSAGLYRLREELLKRVNVAVYPAKVDAVLFKDLIVQ
ncbi:flagellar basal body-associated protein FliL [Methylobacterium sp. J-076]|uniref:flagellar basal body-associated protein FliL n=1 Tax=Methylobacterium sp. J-076 TaxID=2836655 RepID=UPI001FB9864B|nr:flagellar basal body-associated protein FliL [Methylobacterium sp. J-076]MCJ2015753.1 flagellar basal body-associated protein FliL [Methylobacterium sp. J-076]